MPATIADQVRQIVAEQLGVPFEEITLESEFVADLGADSLDLVELVMALEEEYDIEISEEEIEQIVTVGDAVSYIQARVK